MAILFHAKIVSFVILINYLLFLQKENHTNLLAIVVGTKVAVVDIKAVQGVTAAVVDITAVHTIVLLAGHLHMILVSNQKSKKI